MLIAPAAAAGAALTAADVVIWVKNEAIKMQLQPLPL